MARTVDGTAFVIVLVVVFVDTMGLHFSAPAFVPLMTSVGADAVEAGYLLTIRSVASLVCGLWMPLFADTKGRRPAIILSCFGSAAGYLLQGLIFEPSYDSPGTCSNCINLMRVGKAVEGLFSMTLPVALAYVTDITKHEPAQLRARVTKIGAMNQLMPIIVSPIGGAVATFGLQIPALVSCSLAAFTLFFSIMFLKEANVINARRRAAEGKKNDDARAEQEQLKKDAARAAKKNAPSVWKDPRLLGLGVGFFCFAVVITNQMLSTPFLIQRVEFGLDSVSPQKAREDQAKVLGLLGLPGGALQIVTMVALYPRLLARGWAESTLCFAGATISGVACVFYPHGTKLWHLFALGTVSGAGLGVFFGAIMSAPSPYLAKIHPTKISQGRAVYLQCLTIGLIAAPSFLGDIIVKNGPLTDGPDISFLVAGIACIFGGGVVSACIKHMKVCVLKAEDQDVLGRPSRQAAFELREAERTGAKPVDVFLADLSKDIKAQLEDKHYHIHHKGIQILVTRLIAQALPPLVEWKVEESEERVARADETGEPLPAHAMQHLRECARLLEKVGLHERIAAVEKRHALAPGTLAGEGEDGLALAAAHALGAGHISSEVYESERSSSSISADAPDGGKLAATAPATASAV